MTRRARRNGERHRRDRDHKAIGERRAERHPVTSIPSAPPIGPGERCQAHVAAAVVGPNTSPPAIDAVRQQLRRQLVDDLGDRRRGAISVTAYSGRRRFEAIDVLRKVNVDNAQAVELHRSCLFNPTAVLVVAASDAVIS
jgi:hypothetical protein